jgi:hypothetical protein
MQNTAGVSNWDMGMGDRTTGKGGKELQGQRVERKERKRQQVSRIKEQNFSGGIPEEVRSCVLHRELQGLTWH